MSTPNINCILQAIVVVTDQKASNFPQIASFDFQNPSLPSGANGGTVVYWEPYFQASTIGSSVPLPAQITYGLFIRNLSLTANVNLTYTPAASVPTTIFLGPGGVFVYFDPSEAGTGITAITLTGVGGIVSLSILAVA